MIYVTITVTFTDAMRWQNQ